MGFDWLRCREYEIVYVEYDGYSYLRNRKDSVCARLVF